MQNSHSVFTWQMCPPAYPSHLQPFGTPQITFFRLRGLINAGQCAAFFQKNKFIFFLVETNPSFSPSRALVSAPSSTTGTAFLLRAWLVTGKAELFTKSRKTVYGIFFGLRRKKTG